MADGEAVAKKIKKYTPRSIDKLVGVDPQIILDRVAQGDMLREIAADYGCTQPAVSLFIARTVDPETWQTVKQQSMLARLERSAVEIETAPDQLMLARAREAARLWMWRAEREHSGTWGSKPSTAVNINGTDGMQVQLVSYASHTAEQQSLDSEADNRTIIATDTDADAE